MNDNDKTYKMMRVLFYLMMPAVLFLFSCQDKSIKNENVKHEPYQEVKNNILSGWGTFNTQSVLSYVHMPEAFEIDLDFKFQRKAFAGYLSNSHFWEGEEWKDSRIRPLAHDIEGNYTKMAVDWQDVHVIVETAVHNDDFFLWVYPAEEQKYPTNMVVKSGILWNKAGILKKEENYIGGVFDEQEIRIYPAGQTVNDYNVKANVPFFVLSVNEENGFSTGKQRSLEEIKQIIKSGKEQFNQKASRYGDYAAAYEGIVTSVAWNTIYDPKHDRAFTTVSRDWNTKRGGYSFFGWDNFFLSYLAALGSKDLAYANVIEHLNDMTEEGFIPNCSQGNGRKTWDRSQPPVGSYMVREIYKKYPEKWFVEKVFDKLLTCNRWWMDNRLYKGMLSWGAHEAKNPYNDPCYNDLCAAILETGLDDTPMYEGVKFNRDSFVMELHDVGLNGLYVADCETLSELALVIGRDEEAEELQKRADYFRDKLQKLWDEQDGIFYNYDLIASSFHKVITPTLFYPLMAKAATDKQAERMINEHLYNEKELWGEYVLPSLSRSHPDFPKQKYWNGAIWAPLNFLTYLSLNQYDEAEQARADLAEKSGDLFMKEWNRKGYVSENYSAITGTGDDPEINSDPFYAWGALMGIIPLIEQGYMPDPAKSIQQAN